MIARLRVAQREGIELRSNGAVVAQVWRDPSGRQVELARLLRSVDVRPVDLFLGRQAGALSGQVGSGGAVDATVVAIAGRGDRILTGDPADINALVAAARRPILVVAC